MDMMISGRKYPSELTIKNETYQYEKILKEDFFSINVLYRNGNGIRYVLKISDFRFLLGFLLKPFAILMSRREYRLYSMVSDLPNVPELGPRFGLRGYLHRFVEGKTLYELEKEGRFDLPDDFFDKLKALIEEIHRRRIFYLDLNKQGNVILGDNGQPYLIDYQVCIYFKHRNCLMDRIFTLLTKEDIYHLYKHKKNFRPDLMNGEEVKLSERTEFNKMISKYVGIPYRRIKRKIYPSGSNEIVWYKWKKMQNKEEKTS